MQNRSRKENLCIESSMFDRTWILRGNRRRSRIRPDARLIEGDFYAIDFLGEGRDRETRSRLHLRTSAFHSLLLLAMDQ